MSPRTVLREPLLHFLAIGAALFLFFQWRGGPGPGSNRIVVTRGQVDHLAAGYATIWQRPPTQAELKGLVDEWVREEIAVREAMAAGLDRDDAIVRRRLREKFEFVAEDADSAAAPPGDPERRKRRLAALYESLLTKYEVVVETREAGGAKKEGGP